MKRDLVVIGHPMASIASEEQHLLSYLMRNRKVLWVNHDQEKGMFGTPARGEPTPSPEPRRPLVSEFTPHHLIHTSTSWLHGLDQHLLRLQVQRMMQSQKIQHPILWVNSVAGGELAAKLAGHKVIYFCSEAVPQWPMASRQLWLQRQAELVAKADLILATDPAQVSRFPAHKTCLLNTSLPPLPPAMPRPKDLPRGRPIAGFYGTLDDRLDWDFLAQAARSRPDWYWVLIGPNKSQRLTEILRHKNIFWLGEKCYDELTAYLPHWQLLLLPYLTTTSAQPYNPLKLNEYLSLDKPVVMTTLLPQDNGFRPLVSRVHNATELAELLPVHYFIAQEPAPAGDHPSYEWKALLAKPTQGKGSPPTRAINWEQQAATLAGLLDAESKP